jgi:hypothetical protein
MVQDEGGARDLDLRRAEQPNRQASRGVVH